MAPADGDSFASMFEAEKTQIQRGFVRVGERVDVTVTKIGKDAVFVALDGKQEGFVERHELTDREGNLTVGEGARLTAQVVELGGKAGAVRLVPIVVRQSNDAGALATAAPTVTGPVLEVGLKVKGTVTRVERYGVFIQIAGTQGRNGRGLLPAAESGAPRGADLHKSFPVGAELEVKITRIEEDGKIRLSVIELMGDEERREFEQFRGGERKKGGDKPAAPQSFGTFGDLLAKKGPAKR